MRSIRDSPKLMEILESTPEATGFLREFMLFTNDLDRKRDQDFKNVQRELYELILGKWFQMV